MCPSLLSRMLPATAMLLLSMSTSAFAAPTVFVSPSGNSAYTIQGTGMDGVAGIQLDITYDASSLRTPTATQGGLVSGAVFAANTTQPGIIKIAIISSRVFSGSGQIASITFASKTGNGGITSILSSMIDSKGSPIGSTSGTSANDTAAPGNITTPGLPITSTPGNTTTTTTTPAAVSDTIPAYLGAVTMPTDQQQRTDSQPATTATDPVSGVEPATPAKTIPVPAGESTAPITPEQTQTSSKPAVDAKPEETPQYVVYKGILDRFQQYGGSRDLSSMKALFDKKIAQTIHQEPSILLSNGQSKGTLTVDMPSSISSSPNFAVNGGKLISFKQDKKVKGRWTVKVLPEAGAVRTSLTIIAGAEEFEYPLTVAPAVKTALTFDEQGWKRFLKETGTPAAPMHDLNNDGVRDYIDEYVFVANLLARK